MSHVAGVRDSKERRADRVHSHETFAALEEQIVFVNREKRSGRGRDIGGRRIKTTTSSTTTIITRTVQSASEKGKVFSICEHLLDPSPFQWCRRWRWRWLVLTMVLFPVLLQLDI